MDPLGDPLKTRPIQTGWEFTMEPYPSGQFGFIHDTDHQFGNGLVWTGIRTRSDGPEPLVTLCQANNGLHSVDAHSQDRAGSKSLLALIMTTAHTSISYSDTTTVNIWQLAVAYQNGTINCETQNAELEVRTDGSYRTCKNTWVDRYLSRCGPQRSGRLESVTGSKPNWSFRMIWSLSAGW